MAGLAVLFTVISLILTVSHARLIKQKQTVIDLSESDPTTTDVLDFPSEKPVSEPAKVTNYKHDDASEADSELDSVPLTMISFRPVNGHFPRHPLIPFRHKHNSRQHEGLRPLNRRFQRKRYISYGNDMILSDERTRSDSESASQIRSRWAGFSDNGAESNEHIDNYDHEREQDHDGDRHNRRGEEDERHESEEHDDGFMGGFASF